MELRNADKTNEELIREMQELRRQLAELQAPTHDLTSVPISSELAMLTRISAAFDALTDPNHAATLIVDQLQRQLDMRACSVWLLETSSGELVCQHSAGPESGHPPGWRVPLANGVGGWVMQSGESLIVADARAGSSTGERSAPTAGALGRAVLTTPLRVGDRSIGILELADALPHRFDAEFLARVQPLATVAAIALQAASAAAENGRLARLLGQVARSPRLGLAVVDMECTVLLWNSGAEALTGYAPADVVGRDDVWRWLLGDETDISVDLSQAIEERLIAVHTCAGEPRTFAWHSEPLLGRGDVVVGAALVARDVTAQAQAEDAARREMERLRTLRTLDAALRDTRSPAQAADAVLACVPALLGARWSGVLLIDVHTEQITTLASRAGESHDLPASDWWFWLWPFLESLQGGEDVVVDDLEAAEAPAHLQDSLRAAGAGALRVLPLRVDSGLLGLLCLGVVDVGATAPAEEETAREIVDLLTVSLQRALLFDQMSEDRTRLQQLSRRLLAQQEEERRLVARELHDEIGQTLAGLKLGWESMARATAEEGYTSGADWLDVTNDLLTQVRELSSELRPTMLDDLGLAPALLWLFENFTNRTGVSVSFSHVGAERRFAGEIETAFYRIAQEGIRNIAEHAGVRQAIVHLWTEDDALCMRITDHGAGFDPKMVMQAMPAGGLAGMAERATLLGGYLTVESEPGAGATVMVRAPLTSDGTRSQGEWIG
jgi:PAS domain S-box-containing protein